ncbi:hypothetical protein KEM48_005325 [Puccinia striiformis f. sp. tritici PST-130]|nr:hypothetical protein KEM48_005325 [Puccinia striiformis f. sp. tritici PST-130]
MVKPASSRGFVIADSKRTCYKDAPSHPPSASPRLATSQVIKSLTIMLTAEILLSFALLNFYTISAHPLSLSSPLVKREFTEAAGDAHRHWLRRRTFRAGLERGAPCAEQAGKVDDLKFEDLHGSRHSSSFTPDIKMNGHDIGGEPEHPNYIFVNAHPINRMRMCFVPTMCNEKRRTPNRTTLSWKKFQQPMERTANQNLNLWRESLSMTKTQDITESSHKKPNPSGNSKVKDAPTLKSSPSELSLAEKGNSIPVRHPDHKETNQETREISGQTAQHLPAKKTSGEEAPKAPKPSETNYVLVSPDNGRNVPSGRNIPPEKINDHPSKDQNDGSFTKGIISEHKGGNPKDQGNPEPENFDLPAVYDKYEVPQQEESPRREGAHSGAVNFANVKEYPSRQVEPETEIKTIDIPGRRSGKPEEVLDEVVDKHPAPQYHGDHFFTPESSTDKKDIKEASVHEDHEPTVLSSQLHTIHEMKDNPADPNKKEMGRQLKEKILIETLLD